MQDLERDLARYGTVLRQHAPALDLSEIEARRDRPPTNHRPVRSAVAGAMLALASIGLVFLGAVLVDMVSSAGWIERAVVSPAAGSPPGPAVMAVVVGGGALTVLGSAAAVGLRRRYRANESQREARSREWRKRKMQTIEKPVSPVQKLERSNRYLIIGLVVAALLAAGFGAWLIIDNTQSATERDIAELLDSYGAAWVANDGDAVLALMTDDGAVLAGNGQSYSGDALKGVIDGLGEFVAEPVADLLISEATSGRWYVADADEYGLELFNIVERDGDLLIDFHETWRGGSPPGVFPFQR